MFVAIGTHLVNISIPCSGITGWFRLLRRPTFERAQKWAKRPVPTSGPPLRFGCLPYAIAPVWTRRRAIHGPSALARPPCLAPHYAMAPLSLLKGRPAASDIPCTDKQSTRRHSRLRLSAKAPGFSALFFSCVELAGAAKLSLQEVERRRCVAGCGAWLDASGHGPQGRMSFSLFGLLRGHVHIAVLLTFTNVQHPEREL